MNNSKSKTKASAPSVVSRLSPTNTGSVDAAEQEAHSALSVQEPAATQNDVEEFLLSLRTHQMQ
jgi:hypothetical protein